jgi:hypothetical protein
MRGVLTDIEQEQRCKQMDQRMRCNQVGSLLLDAGSR